MKPKRFMAVLAVLALSAVGCSEKATSGDGGGKDAGE